MFEAIVVVDPISTGRVLAQKVIDRGLSVVAVWSEGSQEVSGIGECNIKFEHEFHQTQMSDEEIVASLRALPCNIVACCVGCECGVELNDFLSEKLSLPSNGSVLAEARRDKYAMQERIKECGLRSIKSTAASSFQEVEDFVLAEGLTKWVMKPRRDAGTNGVFMVETLEEARAAWDNITGRTTIFGESNDTVLIQEFLKGKEYVVDTVSHDGVHKAVAIWEYDKVLVHGSAFVGMDDHLYESADGLKEEELAAYTFEVLEALGVSYGCCHAEVMWVEAEQLPCLIEVGTRPHGAGGNFPALCDPVIGYNQLDVSLDAYLAPERFAAVPRRPGPHRGAAAQYKVINRVDGVLESVDLSRLEAELPSFRGVDLHAHPGDRVRRTVDLVTCPAIVRLQHADPRQVALDKYYLRAFEQDLFAVRGARVAVVVDPISTGRVLAEKLLGRGLEVAAVWTKAAKAVEGIGDCDLDFLAEFDEPASGELVADAAAVAAKVRQLAAGLGAPVAACLVGCESGVELCDALQLQLGLPSNGLAQSEARRDKWAMAEAVKAAGLRGIKQVVATTAEEASAFVRREGMSQWILKPRRSAGSQGVYKCTSEADTRRAFEAITSESTIFGEPNPDVLVQEFLVGKEYVVDTVSRQGEHKVVAFWEYDKITLHGSSFVYLDDHLFESADGRKEAALASYVAQVLTALGVKHGPCHAEVMWLAGEDRPCLVEVGARPHGAGGNFPRLCDPVVGYNQLDVLLDSALGRDAAWAAVPPRPGPLTGLGIQYKMICYEEGTLAAVDERALRALPSFAGIDWHRQIGERLQRTVDLVTSPAIVRLQHADREQVDRDRRALRRLERGMLTVRPAKGAGAAAHRAAPCADADLPEDLYTLVLATH